MSVRQVHSGCLITPRYSKVQLGLLDAIGVALNRHLLNWDEAVMLRDRVRAGELRRVRKQLKASRQKLVEAA